MAHKLRNLRLDRVDLVDAGANPEAHIVLYKRVFTPEQRRQLAATGEAMSDGSFPIVNTTDLSNAIQAYGRAGNQAAAKRHIISRARALGAVDQLPPDWNVAKADDGTSNGEEMDFDVTTLDETAQAAFSSLETAHGEILAERDAATARIAELEAELAKAAEPQDVPEADDILKSLPSEVRERLEKAEQDAAANAERIAKMEHENRLRDFIAKAETDFNNIGGATEVGTLIASISEQVDGDTFKQLVTYLKSANALITEGEVFKERGNAGAPSGFEAKVAELAKAKQADNPGLSLAAARTAVMSENSDLYTEYLAARSGK